MPKHVLVVDDDSSLRVVLEVDLAEREYRVTVAPSADAAIAHLDADDIDVVLTDLNMHGMSGTDLCERIVASGRDVPVVVMTAFGSMGTAIAAIRAGAYDFVTKPLDMTELAMTLDRAAGEKALRAEVRRLRAALEVPPLEEVAGASDGMKKVRELVERVAATDVTVLVTGESGSGKELVTRAIHARGARKSGPFVAINCAALPESLLESELFGHTKGAFTDARSARQGLFVRASGGTLFLDEIGEMPLGMQAKLLRALQERRVRPVGGDAEIPFDTRIVAATNLDLEAEVAAKRFREDLYFRINVVRIAVPPLRDRGRDVLKLANQMLRDYQPAGRRIVGFKPAVVEALLSYPWPGNVRELQNCLQRAIAFAEFDHIGLEDLPESIREFKQRAKVVEDSPQELVTVAELERRYVAHVLAAAGHNKTLAARILGIDRRTLYRMLGAAAAAGRSNRNPVAKSAMASALRRAAPQGVPPEETTTLKPTPAPDAASLHAFGATQSEQSFASSL